MLHSRTATEGQQLLAHTEIRVAVPPIRVGHRTCGHAASAFPSVLRTTWQADDRQNSTAGRLHGRAHRDDQCIGTRQPTIDSNQPTLRQAWPRDYPRPQCAFKMSMFNVSCNSHYFTQLAALFIDTRAE